MLALRHRALCHRRGGRGHSLAGVPHDEGCGCVCDAADGSRWQAAICLQAGRPKDHDRMIRFVEAGVLDAVVFKAILQRPDLIEKWNKFQQTCLDS